MEDHLFLVISKSTMLQCVDYSAFVSLGWMDSFFFDLICAAAKVDSESRLFSIFLSVTTNLPFRVRRRCLLAIPRLPPSFPRLLPPTGPHAPISLITLEQTLLSLELAT